MTHDPLRFDFILESSELLASYSISLSEAAHRGNAEACRAYYRCLQAVARDLNKTLVEVENGLASEARQADERKRVEGGGTDGEVRRDKQQRLGMVVSA